MNMHRKLYNAATNVINEMNHARCKIDCNLDYIMAQSKCTLEICACTRAHAHA